MADILETASDSGMLNTWKEAVRAAGLDKTLSGPGPFTVFAPVDEAFEKIQVDRLLEDIPRLRSVLSYHVLPGKMMRKDVIRLSSARTIAGQDVNFDTEGGVKIEGAKLIKPNLVAENGVIHAIDKVIMPRTEGRAGMAQAGRADRRISRETEDLVSRTLDAYNDVLNDWIDFFGMETRKRSGEMVRSWTESGSEMFKEMVRSMRAPLRAYGISDGNLDLMIQGADVFSKTASAWMDFAESGSPDKPKEAAEKWTESMKEMYRRMLENTRKPTGLIRQTPLPWDLFSTGQSWFVQPSLDNVEDMAEQSKGWAEGATDLYNAWVDHLNKSKELYRPELEPEALEQARKDLLGSSETLLKAWSNFTVNQTSSMFQSWKSMVTKGAKQSAQAMEQMR